MSDDFRQGPLLVDFFEQYLDDHDIAQFLRLTSERYFIGTLERIALNGERMARRGAVLALGRLSDYQSNSVLGRAMVDLDRGVRTLAEHAIGLVWNRVGLTIHQRRLSAVSDVRASSASVSCVHPSNARAARDCRAVIMNDHLPPANNYLPELRLF